MLAPIYKCICEEITHLRSQLERHWWQSSPAISTRRPMPAPIYEHARPTRPLLRPQARRNAGARFGGAGGDHAEKRCGETYVTPEIPEMIDEVMKEHRAGKLWRTKRN